MLTDLSVRVFLLWEAAPLTFQHFDGHLGDPVRLLLVQAERLAHHHLTEAAFAQRLSQNQSAQIKSHQTVSAFRLSRMFSLPRVAGGFPALPVPRELPAGVLGQLVLRHPRQHRRTAGGEAEGADQHHT